MVPPPPWRKIALGAAVLLTVAGGAAALIFPEIEKGKDERAAAERRKDAAYEAAKRKRLAREGKPRFGRGDPPRRDIAPAAELRARRALLRDLELSITRDARARADRGNLDGPILRTECEINPPSQRPRERDLDVRRIDYECLAVTADDPAGQFTVGHSFYATVDYGRSRFTWRKVCLPPGEGSARLTC